VCRCGELVVVYQFGEVIIGGMTIERSRSSKPWPIDILDCVVLPLVFILEIPFQRWDGSGLAKHSAIALMNCARWRNDHTRTSREKGGEVDSLVGILEKRFGACFGIAYLDR
jgi:hypothetical protein